MEPVIALVAVVGAFTSIIVIAYLFFNSRHKERMALIQHGQQASIFRAKKDGASGLKFGLLSLGIGLGLFVGSIVESILNTDSPVPHFGMMLSLGGAGLILYYLIVQRREKETPNESDTV